MIEYTVERTPPPPQPEATEGDEEEAEDDMLTALLSLDLHIPVPYTLEWLVKGHVLSVEKWTPMARGGEHGIVQEAKHD